MGFRLGSGLGFGLGLNMGTGSAKVNTNQNEQPNQNQQQNQTIFATRQKSYMLNREQTPIIRKQQAEINLSKFAVELGQQHRRGNSFLDNSSNVT